MALAIKVNKDRPTDDPLYNFWFDVHVGDMKARRWNFEAYAVARLFTETGVPGMMYSLLVKSTTGTVFIDTNLAEKIMMLSTDFKIRGDNELEGKVSDYGLCEKLKMEITSALPALIIRESIDHFQKIVEDHGMVVDDDDTYYFSIDTGEHPIPWASIRARRIAYGLETKDSDGNLHQDESIGTEFRVMERLEKVREWRYEQKTNVFKAVL